VGFSIINGNNTNMSVTQNKLWGGTLQQDAQIEMISW
jgi:hypothetical protein